MTFINEHIKPEDAEKYNLEEDDGRFVVGATRSRNWTIDRERNIYLRVVARGREETSYLSTWVFYWKGYPLVVELENISISGIPGGRRQGHKKLRSMELPSRLKSQHQDILDDLKEALTAYKDGGVYATATDYSLILDI